MPPLVPPLDPFENSQPDTLPGLNQPPQPSSGSPSLPSSRGSTKTGQFLQIAAMIIITYAWLVAGKIQKDWHALVAVISVMLPTNDLTDLAKGAIRAWSRRGSPK
jgi:hypothetical protein